MEERIYEPEPKQPATLHDLAARVDDQTLARLQAKLGASASNAPQMGRRYSIPRTIHKREEPEASG